MKQKLKKSLVMWGGMVGLTLAIIGLVGCGTVGKHADTDTPKAAATANVAWTNDVDCSVCHKTEWASMSDPARSVSKHSSLTCVGCHADEAGLKVAHDGATTTSTMPTKLKDTKIDEKVCLGCHGSYAELAEKTASSAALTDSEGTVVNPHALPVNSEQTHSKITCANCHDMHGGEPKADIAMEACTNCHHQGVFQCRTCHD